MIEIGDAVDELTRSVADLQRRVSVLEGAAQLQAPAAVTSAAALSVAPGAELSAFAPGTGVFSVLGKAMLGIAGAYLLRALAESTVLPRGPVVALAIAYAFLWLWPATRAAAEPWFARVGWAATSVVILIPMLWELTLRFRFLPVPVSAAVLCAFVVAAYSLAWNRGFAAVAWVAAASGSAAAAVLAVATRDLSPFIVALLVMAAAGEFAAAQHRTLRVRPWVAAAADFVLFALIWIYSSPAGRATEYPVIGTGKLLVLAPLLLLVYVASATAQTILLRRRISFFETAQTLVAFLLAVWAVFAFWSGPGAVVLGYLCLIASAAGYAVTFAWFGRARTLRNFHVYATGSLALFLAGCALCLPPAGLALCFSIAAVSATIVGVRTGRMTLVSHGLGSLGAAAGSSGLLLWIGLAMAGALAVGPRWPVLLVSGCAVLCYAAVARSSKEEWWPQLLRVVAGAVAAGAMAALAVWVLVRLVAVGVVPDASHIAVIRTLVTCALALALAWGGSWWGRRELIWLAWATLAFGASKLLFEDVRHGRLEFTAASIFVYAITLLLVPGLVRLRRKSRLPE